MATTPSAHNDAPSAEGATGKGRATPTRAEQEALRKRPLVPDTKEAKARAKEELNQKRERARIGMAAGDDKYLTARDRGPQRRWVRDWVDAGWHLGEVVMPLMLLVIVLTFLPLAEIQMYAFLGLWFFIFLVIFDMIVTSIRVKRAAKRKWGDKTEKGLGWYAAMRTIQMRFMRLPKPQAKRGQYPAA